MVLTQPLTPEAALQAIALQLPDGMRVLSIEQVPLNAPALQATLQSADYTLTIETTESAEAIHQRIQALLDSPTLPRQRRGKTYDLRSLIIDLRVDLRVQATRSGYVTVWARLRASQEGGSGRPDELLDALGLSDVPADICRTGLRFGDQFVNVFDRNAQ
jgi:uncharacterized protein (DUF2344 family)